MIKLGRSGRRRWRGPPLGGHLQGGARFCLAGHDGQANRCRSVESGLGDVKTGGDPSSGISLGGVLRRPKRHPAVGGAKLN